MQAIFASSWVKKRLAFCHSCNHLSTESAIVIHVSGCVGPHQTKETSPGATKVSRTITFSDSRQWVWMTFGEMQKTTAKIASENWESRPHEIASLAAAGVQQYLYVQQQQSS